MENLLPQNPPRHLLGSHTVLGISVPWGGGRELRFIYGLCLGIKFVVPFTTLLVLDISLFLYVEGSV